MTHSPLGSQWHRWDLHFHTPSSFDYQDKSVSNQQLVDGLIENGIRVVAITDHHVMDVERILELQQLGGSELTVLPGIELRSELGGSNSVHYIGVFPENCDLSHVWDTLKGKFGLTPQGLLEHGGDDRVFVPIGEAAEEIHSLKGVVSIHAGTKSNSINEIDNEQDFHQQLKTKITKEMVDLYEVGKQSDIRVHEEVIFPSIEKELPLLLCSDNHNIHDYIVKTPMWLRADPNFLGLRMLIREPKERLFIGDNPDGPARVSGNPTKYIRGIEFGRQQGTTTEEKWFSGRIDFNHGLVAIIGNKGSGKSALADMLGLVGASKNKTNFSFLCKDRFRHPTSGKAKCFDAAITWESGEQQRRGLDQDAPTEEVERIKYLPQEHVERICNELANDSGGKFEQELKSVVFSHVPETKRLGQTTLDDLVSFHTSQKDDRIDDLIGELRGLARERHRLEEQADPVNRKDLENRLELQQAALAAHTTAKPEAVVPPEKSGEDPAIKSLSGEITAAESERDKLTEAVDKNKKELSAAETRKAIANRLLGAVDNFSVQVEQFKDSILVDANTLGINADAIVKLTIDRSLIQAELETQVTATTKLQLALDGTEEPATTGLTQKLAEVNEQLKALRLKLDEPNRKYQAYLTLMKSWEEKKVSLQGSEDEPESIAGLEKAIENLAGLPAAIEAKQQEMLTLAKSIFQVKQEQAEVYRTLYKPVQEFMSSHYLSNAQLLLEFRVELAASNFPERFLSMIARNRKGSFKGVDEGKEKLSSLTEPTAWDSIDSVEAFLKNVDNALHINSQSSDSEAVPLASQLVKEHSPEDLYNYLYGLEYLMPRYLLKWDDKDLSMLSPGERGTVLLVFYLLIDKSDVPLIIDQPEGNLDNHTVAKILVKCIRETRKQRQVFIVTHNPNLAVVCDADQVVHAALDKKDGNAVTYTTGALENPEISTLVTDVLEGTLWAFDVRGGKYLVCDS